jgi:uncharacterized protein YndB with AHSA1/START domain
MCNQRVANLKEARMSEERTVERERVIDAPAENIWEALTDERLLSEWLGDDVELEPYEGGELAVRTDGEERIGTVERLDPGRELSFSWSGDGDAPSLVTLTLEPAIAGTRVRVVERAGSGPAAISGHAWAERLSALADAATLALV